MKQYTLKIDLPDGSRAGDKYQKNASGTYFNVRTGIGSFYTEIQMKNSNFFTSEVVKVVSVERDGEGFCFKDNLGLQHHIDAVYLYEIINNFFNKGL